MEQVIGYSLLAVISLFLWIYCRKKRTGWKYNTYLLAGALLGAVCLVVSLWEQAGAGEKEPLQGLERKQNGGAQEVWLTLEAGGLFGRREYPVTVEERRLTREEAERVLQQAGEEAERLILGENASVVEVYHDLYLPKQLQEGMVEAAYSFEPFELVETDGTILWENLRDDSTLVKVEAALSCQEYQAVHTFQIQLAPGRRREEETLLQELAQRLAAENKRQGENYFSLPKQINDIALTWRPQEEHLAGKLLLFGSAVLVAWYVCTKEKKEREKKAWERQMKLDYPNLVSQLSLLTGTGMTVPVAWGRMVAEYNRQREKGITAVRPGYEEMKKTWNEIQGGVGEQQAWNNFGVRCGQSQYRKFSSILVQNVRKGSQNMQQLLDAEAKEALLQRKLYAKQLGEEAGTKLLIPMGIMMLLVFAILLLPAMFHMQL